MLSISQLELRAPAIEGRVSGTVALADEVTSYLGYEVTRADLAQLSSLIGRQAGGTFSTKGRLSGPQSALRAVGEGSIAQLDAFQVEALTMNGRYDLVVPSGDGVHAKGRVSGHGEFVTVLGQSLLQVSGGVNYDSQKLGFDLALKQQEGREGRLAGSLDLRLDQHEASLLDFTVTLGRLPWRLAAATTPPVVSWNDEQVAVTPLTFAAGDTDGRLGVEGTWRNDGSGALRITASRLFLDTLQTAFERPTRYGGVLDVDATIRGTRERPEAAGTLTVSNGRVERVSYQKLQARFAYAAQMFDVDARLDQAPGTWITVSGKAPLGLLNSSSPEQPIDLTVKSSTISLGLIEGITDVVRNVSGEITIDVKAIGTSRDPHLDGQFTIANAGFLVVPTGSKYKNTRGQFALASERISVESLHIEDSDGHPLDVRGSLGTHELRVGDLQVDGTAHHFEVMHGEFGTIDVDAAIKLQGRFEAPRIAGDITISSGTLRVDEILSRTLFQPYSTEQTIISEIDAVRRSEPVGPARSRPVASRAGDVTADRRERPGVAGHANRAGRHQSPRGWRLVPLQGSGGAAVDHRIVRPDLRHVRLPGPAFRRSRIELDQFPRRSQPRNLCDRHARDLGRRDPRQHLRPAQAAGAASRQHAASGRVRHLSLIVSTPPPTSSATQQHQLVTRAGVLAAGFLAQPIVAAISNETGIDVFEVEPGDIGADIKVTIGHEIAPGLVARFSREFGQESYDEATIEYTLSRLFRLRATFSDAQTTGARRCSAGWSAGSTCPVFQLWRRRYNSRVSTRWA